jgi:hypothetical protein
MTTESMTKTDMLHQIGSDYVLKGLGGKNFDAIPYHEEVELRAPICPGGSEQPLIGKENLRQTWWAPLPNLVSKVELLNTFVNQDENAVAVEFRCYINHPSCVLRVIDRFRINDEGKIVSQENYFDPRVLSNPS